MMKIVIEKAEALKNSSAWLEVCGYKAEPIYSFDNATIHGDAAFLNKVGIVDEARMECPPRSPDMHCPIEHLFGRMKVAFNKWLHSHPAPRTMDAYMAQVQALFEEYATPEQVRGDCAKVHENYEKIIGVEGDVPPKPWR